MTTYRKRLNEYRARPLVVIMNQICVRWRTWSQWFHVNTKVFQWNDDRVALFPWETQECELKKLASLRQLVQTQSPAAAACMTEIAGKGSISHWYHNWNGGIFEHAPLRAPLIWQRKRQVLLRLCLLLTLEGRLEWLNPQNFKTGLQSEKFWIRCCFISM